MRVKQSNIKVEKKDKLTACWKYDREQGCYDLIVNYPLGSQTNTDANYLFNNVFTQEFIKEIQRRGYDISTIKFEISPKFPTSRPDKFETLNKKYGTE
jgi:hypothetical protein